jgi:hypothetical protein
MGDRVPTSGLFLSHIRSPRIDRHFGRLINESGQRIGWRFVYNEGRYPAPQADFAVPSAKQVFPLRFDEMQRNKGTVGGYADTTLWPCVLALDADFTWLMEFDVDFSGDWETFFAQFADNDADLLTTTLVPRAQSAGWYWWPKARTPYYVRPEHLYRAFLPLTRVSRRLAQEYVRRMNDLGWAGHYEFAIPTVAFLAGMTVEDIGGNGSLCPISRRGRNYSNTPDDDFLFPGTFTCRRFRDSYFLEAPESFEEADMLYHPIKPGMMV